MFKMWSKHPRFWAAWYVFGAIVLFAWANFFSGDSSIISRFMVPLIFLWLARNIWIKRDSNT